MAWNRKTRILIPDMHPDFLLEGYRYELPEASIAQEPTPERAGSRLMLLDRKSGPGRCALFADLLSLLPKRALLVANNSRVVPARLVGTRPGGGKVELLLLTPLPLLEAGKKKAPDSGLFEAEAQMLLRPAKKIRPGDEIRICDAFSASLLASGPFGHCRVRLAWQGDLLRLMEEHGSVPLPPYIKRKGSQAGHCDDAGRYQTTYAKKAGSVAAPTAGLHFTPEMLAALKASGREWTELELHVGYGTFSPVRCQDIRRHVMHAEYAQIGEACARAVSRAKAEGRPVIAVGSTSARALEGAFALQGALQGSGGAEALQGTLQGGNSKAALQGGSSEAALQGAAQSCKECFLAPFAGWIDSFIYPGKSFQVIDGLLTNFHLPESSLLMLVAALAGRERVLAAYRQALEAGFRFFSYGDAMLIF